ncbi:MAG: transposase [Bacillota bacterium]
MPRHRREKSKSGYYHVMIRGNERRNIFLQEEDKLRFLETVKEKQGDRFFLLAYCLMDNHVHLLLREGKEDVARVMKRITVSYVYYFNKKYKRVGHLFQDRYRSEVVEQDRYILALVRYIHQNPVKAGMVKRAGEYKWSSYQSYLKEDEPIAGILEKETVLGLFSADKSTAIKMYKEYMDQEGQEEFIDITEEAEIMDEEEAQKLYESMLRDRGLKSKRHVTDEIIRQFKAVTGLSIRKIAGIVGLNKDKVNKILKA